MPRKLIIHIGTYKTGSTALQQQLGKSRETLAAAGILYPTSARPAAGFENHSGMVFQLLDEAGAGLPAWYRRSSLFQRLTSSLRPEPVEELTREIRDSPADTVVVSSEEFLRLAGRDAPPSRRVRSVVESWGFDTVTVVCYLRRPDRYLESWYNQLVKLSTPVPRLSTSLGRYLGTVHTDLDRALCYWVDEIGCDALVARNYDRLTDGSIVADFREATGVPVPDVRPGSEAQANQRIDNNFIEYARLWSLFRPGANNQELLDLLEDLRAQPYLPRLREVHVLGPGARRRLLEYTEPINGRVGALVGMDHGFFGDLDEMLYLPPGSISDRRAFRLWAPYLDAAVQARGVRVRKRRGRRRRLTT